MCFKHPEIVVFQSQLYCLISSLSGANPLCPSLLCQSYQLSLFVKYLLLFLGRYCVLIYGDLHRAPMELHVFGSANVEIRVTSVIYCNRALATLAVLAANGDLACLL